jgi:hypothetical protein
MPELSWKSWNAVLLCAAALLPSICRADVSLTFGLDSVISGGAAPSPEIPWGTATFSDIAPGVVKLDLALSGDHLPEGAYVQDWYFNFGPELNVHYLQFSAQVPIEGSPVYVADAPVGEFSAPTVAKSQNGFNAGGISNFDIRLHFAWWPSNRFGPGETYSVLITSAPTQDFNAGSFKYQSAAGAGNFYTVARIAGYGDSVWAAGNLFVPPIDLLAAAAPVAPEISSIVQWSLLGGLGLGCYDFRRCFGRRLIKAGAPGGYRGHTNG